jgi:uncharacterized protein YbcV (DUF1398 family)
MMGGQHYCYIAKNFNSLYRYILSDFRPIITATFFRQKTTQYRFILNRPKTTHIDLSRYGLGFLEPREVEECFVFDVFSEAPESEKAIEFADYVVRNYIELSSSFPPTIWADADVECKRTTNGCESFHKEFGTMFYSSHPSIFNFLDKVQSVQTKSYSKMRATRNRILPKQKENNNTAQKRELKAKYDSGEMTRQQYVKQMAFKALPIV